MPTLIYQNWLTVAMIGQCTELEVPSFIYSRDKSGFQNLKRGYVTQTTPPFGPSNVQKSLSVPYLLNFMPP